METRGPYEDSALNYMPQSKMGGPSIISSKHYYFNRWSLSLGVVQALPIKAEFMGDGCWEAGKTPFKKPFIQDNYKHWSMMGAN